MIGSDRRSPAFNGRRLVRPFLYASSPFFKAEII